MPRAIVLSGVTLVLWFTAFILMLVGFFRCDFVKYETTDPAGDQVVSRGFGLWWYEYWYLAAVSGGGGTDLYVVESCASYPSSFSLDNKWKASQAFAILVLLFAFCTLILQCVVGCADDVTPGVSTKAQFPAPLLLATALCQGLVLLFLGSEACHNNALTALGDLDFPTECSLSTGANCTIAALVFWLAAAASSFMEGKAWAAEAGSGDIDASLSEQLHP